MIKFKMRLFEKLVLTATLMSSGELCAIEGTVKVINSEASETDAALEEQASTISNSSNQSGSEFYFDSEFIQKSETCSQLSTQRCVSCCEDFFIAGSEAWDQCQVTCSQPDIVANFEY